MALNHNAVVTELWRRINEALTIPLQTAATAASDALLAQIAAEAARDEAADVGHMPGASIIPADPITGRQKWTEELEEVIDPDSPPGRYYNWSAYAYNSEDYFIKVDPELSYYVSFWIKADIAGSVLYIEALDENTKTTALGYNVQGKWDSRLMSDYEVPTEWTRLETRGFGFKEGTTLASLRRFYFNHPKGSVRNATISISDIHMVPIPKHNHVMADVSDLPILTYYPHANSIVQRGTDGRARIQGPPINSYDIANKSYVDDELSKQTHVLEEISDYPGHDASNTPNTLIRRNSTGLASISYPAGPQHIANKAYVDDSRVLNQVYEAYRAETPIEITASGPIFPFPQGLGGNLTITAIVNTTEEYYYARDGGSRTLWLVRLRDRYGNVLEDPDHNDAIVGATWTSGGIGGANYYSYVTPPPGENVELSYTFNLQPGYYIDAIAIRKWDNLQLVGHSLTAVKVESHPDPEAAINALPGHDYVDRVRDELGEQIADIDSGLGDHTHLSEDITDAVGLTSTSTVGQLVKTSSTGNVQSYQDPVEIRDLTRKHYVDNELKKKAPLEHRHTSEQIDGLDDTLNTAMTTKADITYVDDQDSIQFLKDRSGNTQVWDLPASAVSEDANDLVVRGSDGVIHQTILPDDDSHVANKQYVDAMSAAEIVSRNLALATKADVSHRHSIADVTAKNGTTHTYDLPPSNATTSLNDIVVRAGSGRIKTPTPSAGTDAANKGYVDDNVPWIGSRSAYNSVTKSSGRLYVIT